MFLRPILVCVATQKIEDTKKIYFAIENKLSDGKKNEFTAERERESKR